MAGAGDGEGSDKRDMTSDRWQQVERLYHAALAREGAQAAFLKEACAGMTRCGMEWNLCWRKRTERASWKRLRWRWRGSNWLRASDLAG